jgi:hypothetical protein
MDGRVSGVKRDVALGSKKTGVAKSCMAAPSSVFRICPQMPQRLDSPSDPDFNQIFTTLFGRSCVMQRQERGNHRVDERNV